MVNFLKQHPDLEKEVADDGCVEQRLIDFEKRCADAFFRLEQMVELRAAQSLELEKRIQAIASGEERIAGRSRGPSRVSTAKKSVIPKRAAEARKARAKAAAEKEVAAFKEEFLSAARQCFRLIDKDGGGSLSKAEIVEAVKSDEEVIKFLTTCGEENLQFLLHPPRLQKALEILDTDKSGEVDADEWRVAGVLHRYAIDAIDASSRAQGGGHQPGPLEARRAAQGRAGAARARGAAGGRGIFCRISERGARGLPHDRRRRERHAREG